MPFNRTSTVPSINSDSTVTVRFTGLMLLKSGAGNTCEVGVHRLTDSHAFQAMLVVHRPDRPLIFIRLTTGPLTAPFSVDAVPAPSAGFLAFAQEPFAPNNPNSHELDYRWALNMRKWHPNADFNDGARPVVKLNAGILYALNLTRTDLNPGLERATLPGSAPEPLHRFATDLAVAIDIPPVPDGGVAITWEESGATQQVILPRKKIDPTGTTYTISLMNDPPASILLTDDVLTPADLRHDELSLYYRVLQDGGASINENQRVKLHVPDPGRTDEIPCMPVTLDP